VATGPNIRMLGPLRVSDPDGPRPIGGRRQRAVLAVLLLAHGRSVPTERLVDDVWGGSPPPSASGTVHAYVSRLRRILGDHLSRDEHGYRCVIDDDSVDLWRFERLVSAGDDAVRRGADRVAAEAYGQALEAWSGDMLLGELGTEPFAHADVARVAAMRLHATTERFDALLRLDAAADLVPELEGAVASHPYTERLWEQLMLAQYRAGRQVAALRTFRRAAKLLRDEVGVEPGSQLTEIERRILARDPGLAAQALDLDRREAPPVPTNLRHAATSFVGRAPDLIAVQQALATHRVVTLVGPGGVGKTRLAVEVTWTVLDRYPGGAWDVDLTAAAGDDDVVPILAEVVGTPVRAGSAGIRHLTQHIGDRPTLLVLDNCEHVVSGVVALIADLLRATPASTVLATSRVPLKFENEHRIVVSPLSTTDVDAPAVALFRERARSSTRSTRNDDNVLRIVRRMDGVPLGVELAAAATALLTPSQLADELDRRTLGLVDEDKADARHRSLHGTIEWSYDLLDVPAQLLLTRLSIFSAPFRAEDAAEVCGTAPLDVTTISGRLAELADRSLLVPPDAASSDDGDQRWRLFEVVREYAAERAVATGVVDDLQRRHAACYASFAAEMAHAFHGPDESRAMRRLRAEHPHLTAALRHLAGRARSAAVRDLWYWWYCNGFVDEAMHWLTVSLRDLAPDDPLASELLAASALVASGSGEAGWIDRAVDAGRRAIELATTHGGEVLATVQLLVGDALSVDHAHLAEGERLLVAARDHFLGSASPGPAGWAELRLVRADGFLRADLEGGRSRLARSVTLLEDVGDRRLLAYAQMVRANMARLHGDVDDGVVHAREAVGLHRLVDAVPTLAEALEIQVDLLIEGGHVEAADRAIDELEQHVTNRRLTGWESVIELDRCRCMVVRGEHAPARVRLDAELHDRRDAQDVVGTAAVLEQLAPLVADAGEADGADRLVEEYEGLIAQGPTPWNQLAAFRLAADVALVLGRTDEAEAKLRAVFAEARRLRQRTALAEALEGLGVVHQRRGRPHACIELIGAARRLRDECGAEPLPRLAAQVTAAVRRSRGEVSAPEFASCWHRGASAGSDIEP
jgi:predicted ATPase/DNA-binding SARP family transcriptional activator